MKTNKTIQELFSFPGFKASNKLQGKFGDSKARIVVLQRRKKQQHVLAAVAATRLITIVRRVKHVLWIQPIIASMCAMKDAVSFAKSAKACV